MQFDFKTGNVSVYPNGQVALLVNLPEEYKDSVNEINKLIESDDLKTIEIKKFKEKRSKDANAGFWIMCDRIAKKVGNTKDNIYVIMVKTYGIFDDFIMLEEAFPISEKRHNDSSSVKFDRKKYSLCDINERYTKNGVKWVESRFYHGTSIYDRDQFKPLLDGVIDEAKTLGIDFFSKKELEQMLDLWEKRKVDL